MTKVGFEECKVRIVTRVVSPEGKVVKEQRFFAKSFLKNWSEWARGMWNRTRPTMVDTGGEVRSPFPYFVDASNRIHDFTCTAPAEDDAYGVFIGTGVKVPETDDYNLEAKIPHGTATGQMSYGATSVGAVAVEAYESAFRVERVFANYSGADITVSEVGLAHRWFGLIDGIEHMWYFLTIRDLLPTPDTVPDGYSYMVSYEILHKAYG